MKRLLLLACFAISSVHAQQVIPLAEACKANAFCVDCGKPKAAYNSPLLAYFTAKIDKAKANQLSGGLLIQLLVDTKGKVCARELTNYTQSTKEEILSTGLIDAINTMPAWQPAVEGGKPINSIVLLLAMFNTKGVDFSIDYYRIDAASVEGKK